MDVIFVFVFFSRVVSVFLSFPFSHAVWKYIMISKTPSFPYSRSAYACFQSVRNVNNFRKINILLANYSYSWQLCSRCMKDSSVNRVAAFDNENAVPQSLSDIQQTLFNGTRRALNAIWNLYLDHKNERQTFKILVWNGRMQMLGHLNFNS